MMGFLTRLQGDRSIWLALFMMVLVSALAVYSTTSTLALRFRGGDTEHYLLRHAFHLLVGLGMIFLIHRVDYRHFARVSNALLVVSVVLCAYTLFQGQEHEVNSANRWISVFGISFQASDLGKFSLMVYLAKTLTERQETIRDFRKGFVPVIAVVILICGFIAPANLSTAVLLFMCSFALMFTAGIQLRFLAGLVGVGFIGLLILFAFAPRVATWQSRLDDYTQRFTQKNYEPNYQTVQSNIAIVSGGLTGKGPGKSVQRNYLPQPYSDFVYAIIIEEYGLLGGLFVLGLYMWILFRTVIIVTFSRTFGALLAAGLAFLITAQAVINMGVTVGIMPVTGLPLPLISMGGTSLIFTSMAFGIILSVSREARPEHKGTPRPIPAFG
jgi:cell division protein FtsW